MDREAQGAAPISMTTEPDNTPYRSDTTEAELWLENRMREQRLCKHPKSHDEGGVEYCNVCGKSLRINTYRD